MAKKHSRRGEYDAIDSEDEWLNSQLHRASENAGPKKTSDSREMGTSSGLSPSNPKHGQPKESRKSRHRERNTGDRRRVKPLSDAFEAYKKEKERYDAYEVEYKERLEAVAAMWGKFDQSTFEDHPAYQTEWKNFYRRKSIELKKQNIDPRTYDFIPEWRVAWIEKSVPALRQSDDEGAKTKAYAALRFSRTPEPPNLTEPLATSPVSSDESSGSISLERSPRPAIVDKNSRGAQYQSSSRAISSVERQNRVNRSPGRNSKHVHNRGNSSSPRKPHSRSRKDRSHSRSPRNRRFSSRSPSPVKRSERKTSSSRVSTSRSPLGRDRVKSPRTVSKPRTKSPPNERVVVPVSSKVTLGAGSSNSSKGPEKPPATTQKAKPDIVEIDLDSSPEREPAAVESPPATKQAVDKADMPFGARLLAALAQLNFYSKEITLYGMRLTEALEKAIKVKTADGDEACIVAMWNRSFRKLLLLAKAQLQGRIDIGLLNEGEIPVASQTIEAVEDLLKRGESVQFSGEPGKERSAVASTIIQGVKPSSTSNELMKKGIEGQPPLKKVLDEIKARSEAMAAAPRTAKDDVGSSAAEDLSDEALDSYSPNSFYQKFLKPFQGMQNETRRRIVDYLKHIEMGNRARHNAISVFVREARPSVDPSTRKVTEPRNLNQNAAGEVSDPCLSSENSSKNSSGGGFAPVRSTDIRQEGSSAASHGDSSDDGFGCICRKEGGKMSASRNYRQAANQLLEKLSRSDVESLVAEAAKKFSLPKLGFEIVTTDADDVADGVPEVGEVVNSKNPAANKICPSEVPLDDIPAVATREASSANEQVDICDLKRQYGAVLQKLERHYTKGKLCVMRRDVDLMKAWWKTNRGTKKPEGVMSVPGLSPTAQNIEVMKLLMSLMKVEINVLRRVVNLGKEFDEFIERVQKSFSATLALRESLGNKAKDNPEWLTRRGKLKADCDQLRDMLDENIVPGPMVAGTEETLEMIEDFLEMEEKIPELFNGDSITDEELLSLDVETRARKKVEKPLLEALKFLAKAHRYADCQMDSEELKNMIASIAMVNWKSVKSCFGENADVDVAKLKLRKAENFDSYTPAQFVDKFLKPLDDYSLKCQEKLLEYVLSLEENDKQRCREINELYLAVVVEDYEESPEESLNT
ncbi:unnamed protein product [Notodromas monacha]|uniref:Uncharacterized protein n=1 Tax=Notodromas monacha TaxID=399045 RepID=A0A7R9GBY8_9CRUS|nr:unnamed protein product [Notodromas monacha]CAG0915296.1 unnamed protein product [Notodromas monacha]